MTETGSTPSGIDILLDASERTAHLPQSQAFEQVMYDNMTTRLSRFMADEPISFHPRLLRTQFPQNLKDCFISSNELQLDHFRIVQLLKSSPSDLADTVVKTEPERQSQMVFETNDVTYTFITNGEQATMSIETINGLSSRTLSNTDYTAFLASIVYAAQYDHADPDAQLYLADETLYERRDNADADESLVERLIMTLGDLKGQAETTTSALFDTGTDLLEADLISRENPRVTGVNNTMTLSRVTGTVSDSATIHQNDIYSPKRLTHHYAESKSHDFSNTDDTVTIIDPAENFEKWATICAKFISHIQPLLDVYEAADETY